VLPGISTEQLRSRLNRMVADGMLTRKRFREVPPRVDYELTERARELMPVLGELARWGYEWAWGPPNASESVDLGAIFRLAPGLINATSATRGTIELTVEDAKADGAASYTLTVFSGRATIAEHAAEMPDARVTGTTAEWIEAFSPAGNRSGLKLTGDGKLANVLLDGLALASALSSDAQAATA
jgi:hypothetical protein